MSFKGSRKIIESISSHSQLEILQVGDDQNKECIWEIQPDHMSLKKKEFCPVDRSSETLSLRIKWNQTLTGLECSILHEDTCVLSKQGPGIRLLMSQRSPMSAFGHKVLLEHGNGHLFV